VKDYHIFLGFSGLKTELRTKLKIEKPERDLLLWFSTADGTLRLHYFDQHKIYFILGIRSPSSGSWKIYVEKGSYQYQLTDLIIRAVPYDQLAEEFNRNFRVYGHWRRKIR
jgi:hypothetical protein